MVSTLQNNTKTDSLYDFVFAIIISFRKISIPSIVSYPTNVTLHKMFNLTIYAIKLYLIDYIPKDNSFPFSFLPSENFIPSSVIGFSPRPANRIGFVADTIRGAELPSYL